MKFIRALFFLGIWTTMVPFLGFPMSFRNAITALTGIAITVVSYFLFKHIRTTRGLAKPVFTQPNDSENYHTPRV